MITIIFSLLAAVAVAAPQYNIGTPIPAPAPIPSYNVPVQAPAPAPVPSYRAPVQAPAPALEYGSKLAPVEILRDDRQGPDATGAYSFAFETADGISRQEQGTPEGPNGAVSVQGGWSFTFPDGTPGVFNFVADGAGYRPESPLLPTPHPLPAHAIAQIEFARQQEAAAAASGASNRYSAPAPDPAPAPTNQYVVPPTVPAPQRTYQSPR
ncbi:endocuticle structural glycoprotein SgAbd-8-like [Cherax quadricarinatus]|uniref:endocuticle structural glycoprotein SgAbd-8-like n=1 Tax=Cherax quadricarinatus TaxID=27406 RepID=UPI002379DFF2|nr:endocuticle structural glycoprotein SgAbd-8-like [Cherax quadricarinatus]